MKFTIAKLNYYEISVDTDKNRIYYTITGKWVDTSLLDNFHRHWEEAVNLMKPNFTILTNSQAMKIHRQEIEIIQGKAQEYVMKHGLLWVAEVKSQNDIVNFQTSRVGDKSGLPIDKFATIEEAEKYLDQKVRFLK